MNSRNLTITDEQYDYEQYDLTENPFPYSPVPADEPQIYSGQKRVTSAVEQVVSTTLQTGKSRHLVITGKYGNGKSHTLKYTRSQVRNRDDVLAGYVAQPGEGFADIYHEFMYDLGFNRIQRLAYEYLAQVARKTTDRNPIGPQAISALIEDGEVLLSELVPTAIQRLSDITHFADFARALIHLVYEDTNLYAWQWLTAEGLRYEQRKEMEIHSALDDDTACVRAFTALKNLLLELGYVGVFVFIDEFESIARQTPKSMQTTLNSVRHLMDQNSQGLCLLFGCAPEIWQEIMAEYHAFAERIGSEVSLQPLTADDTATLIRHYLNTARSTPSEEIVPFTEASVEEIHQQAHGNIRQILQLCSKVLDHAVETEAPVISVEIVEETPL
jgi:type II secretory pathway predicted ATPase ExeA